MGEAAMSRSVHVPAGIFDRRRYGFAQVAIVPTLLEEVVLPDQRSTARQNRRCLRDDSLDHLRG
jgi:hypothetical protein